MSKEGDMDLDLGSPIEMAKDLVEKDFDAYEETKKEEQEPQSKIETPIEHVPSEEPIPPT